MSSRSHLVVMDQSVTLPGMCFAPDDSAPDNSKT
jgi:hypothetical protein